MLYEIEPYIGAGPIHLNMTQQEIRQIIGPPLRSVRQPFQEYTTDQFSDAHMTTTYRYPGICNSINFYGPATPTFGGRKFLNQPFAQARHWFRVHDPDVEIDASGLQSYKFGIALFAPEAPRGRVKDVLIFEHGYYDELHAIQKDGALVWSMSSVGLIRMGGGPGFLRFGMAVEEVRREVGTVVRTYDNAEFDWPSDAFDSLGVHVHYRQPGSCVAVEFTGPAYPGLGARRLLGIPYSEAYRWFTALDPMLNASQKGFTSRELGVSVSASDETLDAIVKRVVIFDNSR